MTDLRNCLIYNGVPYNICQINGQKIVGPPITWTGPSPADNCEVFINNLSPNLTENDLMPVLTGIGVVYQMRLMMRFSGQNRGFCFVLFDTPITAQTAIHRLRGYFLGFQNIYVSWSRNKKTLVFGGIEQCLSDGVVSQRLTQMVSPQKIEFVLTTEGERAVVLYFNSHRNAALCRRILLIKLREFGPSAWCHWSN